MKPRVVAAMIAPVAALNLTSYVVAVTPAPVPNPGANTAIPAPVGSAEPVSTTTPTPATPSKAPVSLFEDPAQISEPANLNVHVVVPIQDPKQTIDVLAVHPYPVKPPVLKNPPAPLPTDPKSLKNLLLQSAYNGRETLDKIYPIGGMRWQYVYRSIVRKANIGVPHTIFGAYQWIDRVMPIAVAESTHFNEIEAERQARLQKTLEDFDKNREEFESQAVSNGLYPIQLRARRDRTAQGQIPAGSWWLTCTRKAPGLTFYWQVPFTAAPGENVNLTLTQANALLITGGW